MKNYSIHLTFELGGKAARLLEGKDFRVPSPSPELQFIPALGDMIRLEGAEHLVLVVIGREISFGESALEVVCYLDAEERKRLK